MKLVIVTINYNSSENTLKLLESLKNQTSKDFDVIVVDNASFKTDFNNLNTYYTTHFTTTMGTITNIIKITFIKKDRNLGYSGGNNVGIKKALEMWGADPDASVGAGWVLLLNNDTMPESHLIEQLRVNLEGKEGVFGLALDEGDGTAFAGKISWLKPTLIHITTRRVVHEKSVDKLYAIGGAILIHKDVFDKIGFLDENYFLYFEDADFCQRAKRAGIPVSFLPEIKISHSVSASTKKLGSPMLLRYHYRNALYFNFKNGPWYIKLLVWPWSWIIVFKQIVKIVIKTNVEQSQSILVGVIDFYNTKFGKINHEKSV